MRSGFNTATTLGRSSDSRLILQHNAEASRFSAELAAYRRVAFSSFTFVVAWWLLVGVCSGSTLADRANNVDPVLEKLFGPANNERLFGARIVGNDSFRVPPTPVSTGSSDFGIDNGDFVYSPDESDGEAEQWSLEESRSEFSQVSATHDVPEWQRELEAGETSAEPASFSSTERKVPVGEWQVLPQGLLYRSYLAGYKEPRMQWVSMYDTKSQTRLWEATLGGRVGLLRKGTSGAVNPQGFQLDLEGAVFARVLPDEPSSMLAASDYRVGLLGTWREDDTAYKAGYYHISSHVGDEFLLANPTFNRLNYVRDSLITGVSRDLTPNTQLYGEIGIAVGQQGGAEWLEFQYGAQYAPPTPTGFRGAPFAAVNSHTRQDFGWVNGVNCVTGWGWQGAASKHRLRIGLNYYNGPSLQYVFLNQRENLIGGGIWFDY